ncbi:odorant receptor Or1-like [Leptopilina heterotoma]|uniref:odorant receptor Or1-like n=1 Tax=Leptopilina heterotoma TaxID=63436 RepID=UPI001CA9DBC0|nr:odorant receptor Or1-like [Leptopilina heterotoma]
MDIYKTETFAKKVKPHLHIRICLKILRYTGTWPPEELGSTRVLFFIYSIFAFIFILGIYNVVQFVNIIKNYNDVNKLASGGPLFITNALNAYKFITIIRYHRRIYKLLSIIDSPMFSKDNVRYERIVSWYAWQGIFHHGVYQIFGFFAVFFWASVPLYIIINDKENKEKELPLDAWYPYDTTGAFAFIITWAHQGIAILLCCINNLAIDSFIAGLINVASCQFEILKWNFSSLANNIEEENISSNLNENELKIYKYKKINDQIRSYIQHNLAIFDFVTEIENIFSRVVGLQLLLSCFVICLSTFYVSQATTFTPVEFIGNFAYVLCMTYQIFVYTFQGNELYLQNENLCTAIYMGNWWKLNTRYKRDLYMIMIRTRRPLVVSTTFLIKLTIPTFMSVSFIFLFNNIFYFLKYTTVGNYRYDCTRTG